VLDDASTDKPELIHHCCTGSSVPHPVVQEAVALTSEGMNIRECKRGAGECGNEDVKSVLPA
jgi:hypothetical protein